LSVTKLQSLESPKPRKFERPPCCYYNDEENYNVWVRIPLKWRKVLIKFRANG
jgi:hypothetical protein